MKDCKVKFPALPQVLNSVSKGLEMYWGSDMLVMENQFLYSRLKIQKAVAYTPSREAVFQLAAMLTAAVPAVSGSSSLALRSAILMSVLSLYSDICIHTSSYFSFLHFHHNNTQHITKAL